MNKISHKANCPTLLSKNTFPQSSVICPGREGLWVWKTQKSDQVFNDQDSNRELHRVEVILLRLNCQAQILRHLLVPLNKQICYISQISNLHGQ